jgi:hypothetical protein
VKLSECKFFLFPADFLSEFGFIGLEGLPGLGEHKQSNK